MGAAYEDFLEREVERLKADLAQETKTRLKVMAERDRLMNLVIRAQQLLGRGGRWQQDAKQELSPISQRGEDNRKAFYDAFGLTGREI